MRQVAGLHLRVIGLAFDSTGALPRPSACRAIPGECGPCPPSSSARAGLSSAPTYRDVSRFCLPPPHCLADGNEVPQFFQIGLGHDFAEPGNPWKPAMKSGPLAENQGEQTRTQQENAGDGHCQESIGCKFFTHGAYPTSARGNGSGAPCEIVSADFSHPCPAMPAVKPAIFAVEQGEMFPHRSHPVV